MLFIEKETHSADVQKHSVISSSSPQLSPWSWKQILELTSDGPSQIDQKLRLQNVIRDKEEFAKSQNKDLNKKHSNLVANPRYH